MKKIILATMIVASQLAFANAEPGKPAPDFTLTGSDGKTYKLSDFRKGKEPKIVVLEWFNEGCPYVRKHYNAGNMQRLQRDLKANGKVAWLTIASSARGKQGYLATPADAAKVAKDKGMASTALLLDPGSKVAKEYQAKTTPHMFVIDTKGLVAYNGAIDSDDTAEAMKVDEYVKNDKIKKYVEDAVAAVAKGETPKKTSEEPYGCSIKY